MRRLSYSTDSVGFRKEASRKFRNLWLMPHSNSIPYPTRCWSYSAFRNPKRKPGAWEAMQNLKKGICFPSLSSEVTIVSSLGYFFESIADSSAEWFASCPPELFTSFSDWVVYFIFRPGKPMTLQVRFSFNIDIPMTMDQLRSTKQKANEIFLLGRSIPRNGDPFCWSIPLWLALLGMLLTILGHSWWWTLRQL